MSTAIGPHVRAVDESDLRVAVHAGSAPYAIAVAELPRSARIADSVSGAIVTLGGHGRWDLGVEQACAAGAVAMIVDSPAIGSVGLDLGLVVELASRVPLVLARPRLRPDVASDALATRRGDRGAAIIAVECAASTAGYRAMLCDAVGWARTLAGGTLSLASAGDTGQSVAALLVADQGASSHAVTILGARRDAGAEWLRAAIVGATRTEVAVQGRMRSAEVERADAEGRLRLPTRFESGERLALRRVLEAVRDQVLPTDADELRHDARLVGDFLDGPR
ncbi:hypothetical protein [Naasia lichenicola]|uniref:Uncharacterized protein n=1 Tax=Naasia lichenicola TaxID=2565933 RepID=A0A4S4FN51_9MICO|nr:hypothetical protein [Naasia lichenicola]THG31634.1 hypothetical protein E6C64_06070 [Naasia lichenicola]